MASARSSKYIGSSATFMKTKARLSKSLDRDATLAKTFKYTHTLKENKERYADQRSADHYESYMQRLEATTQQSQQSGEDASGFAASIIDPDAVWYETALAPYKNHVYGLGSFFASSLRTSTFASATSRTVDPEEGVDLSCRERLKRLQRMEQQMALYQAKMRASGSGAAGGTQTSLTSSTPQQDHGNDNDDYQDI
ncbi:uncharacterized protein DS421_13g407910 [Arachis hypogaea]|nr:uncharacterized protein DS421_13g407910 [Arachis hypogaea]